MGLDITAYKQLKIEPNAAKEEDGSPVDWKRHVWIQPATVKWTNDNFPGRADPIQGGIYSASDSFGFRAGSYGGYNAWRDWLARLAGYPSAAAVWEDNLQGPFAELINFADNEGVIGTTACAKLAKDFADHADKAGTAGYDAKLYQEWRTAFEMAADGGCVDFH